MKYEFYCRMNEDINVINFLKDKNIKYETGPLAKRIYFTVYSDTENCDEFLKYIRALPDASISKLSVFSKQEMEDANWYLLYVTRMGMETKKVDYTYDAKCPYVTEYGMRGHHHLDQVMVSRCNHCDKLIKSHIVCPYCGYYKNKQIIANK